MKQRLAKRLYAKEDVAELESWADSLGTMFSRQQLILSTYQLAAPTYAEWTTDEQIAKIKGGELLVSGSAMIMADYMSPEQVEAFYAKYMVSDAFNVAFVHFWFRLAWQAKEWGYFKDADTVEETLNVDGEQELANLFVRVQHELTRFVMATTSTSMSYDELFASMGEYLKHPTSEPA
ncbi:hypothetical protein [Paraburkholderia sp. BCC1886]|uniref:hypothetical protein n=1 Tax=Paraburkholderia sp. BCC1886 TaxID=2562670 RepID=UPI001183669C|nr:hypothetical protein [Paraburkholderia sp. BCC1886]